MNTIMWNYYVFGSALCMLVQFVIILLLLTQRRREKREIQALSASERMYRLLTEKAEDLISRHAPDGRLLYISPVCLDMLGYTPDEILHHGMDLFVHPDDLKNFWNAVYEGVAAGNEHYNIQHRIRHKQGYWAWAEIKGHLLYDDNGKLAEIHCLVRDITDRKQIEDTLRANEEKFRAFFGLVPVVSSVSSYQEGRFLEVNESFLQTLGFQRDEVIGKTASELNLWVDPAGRAQLLEPFQQHDSVRDLEIDIRTKSGVVLNTLFSCDTVEIGGQQCLITAFTDITERKRNEEALRESEVKFRTIFENAPASIVITRATDGTYVDVNRRFVETTGFSKPGILNRRPSDPFVHVLNQEDFERLMREYQDQGKRGNFYRLDPSDDERMRQEFQTQGRLESFSFKSYASDGRILHHLNSAYPIQLHGETCVLSIVTDITELKKAEEDLREREEKYHVLFDNMAQGAMYQLADGRVEEVNAAALEMFDVSYDEFVKDPTSLVPGKNVIHKDGSECSIEEFPSSLAFKSGKPVRNVTIGVSVPQKQAYTWIDITAIPQYKPSETQPYRVFTTFHDVTALKQVEQELRIYQEHLEELVEDRTLELQREIEARKQSERSLRESEGQYRLIAENATDVIWTANAVEGFTYISPSVQRLRGYTPEEAMQQTFEQTLTAESWNEVKDLLSPKYEDEEGPIRFEIEQVCKDGSTVWGEAVVKRLYNASGERTGFLGISRDISERKQAEAALQKAKNAAESANQAKSMFLSSMSHELRTPLNAILGFAQLLARETTLSLVQQEYIDTINRSGEHLLHLINDVLDMSKIEAGRVSVTRSSFDFLHMLTNVEEMMRVRAEQKGLEFYVEHPSNLPRYIETDEKKLRQILINVLGNAVKFTKQGCVTLRIFASGFKALDLRKAQSKTSQLKFEISDTGPGIAQEELTTIFETFRQTSHARHNEGTGLGLAISRQFAQLLGGNISVESDVGRGSRFSFDIQVELVERSSVRPSASTRTITGLASSQTAVRILVVDDHAESGHLIQRLLGDVGFDVNEAANGREALRLLKKWVPDLILMDMRMPVMDGYEATLAIREQERAKREFPIPIIAMTASVFEKEQQQILKSGCNMLLRKPISVLELFEAIRSYLGVEYIYEADERLPNVHPPKDSACALTPDTLADLPDALIESLKDGVISGNQVLMTEVVGAIREHKPELADSIAHLVYSFKYQELWKMIQQITLVEGTDE